MTITLRTEKGSPLTIAELDGNFTDLDNRVTIVEDGQTSVKSIEEITQVGNSLLITYTDSSTDGPFTFDVAINYRGDWEPLTAYAQNDLVHAAGVVYIVLLDHTSGSEFDPGASAGTAGDYYGPFLEMPELTLPAGGDTGYVLSKASSTDYDVQWTQSALPIGGNVGEVLTKVSGDDYDAEWAAVSPPLVLTVTSDTLDAAVLGYANIYFRCTASGGCVVTLPTHTELPFPIGTEMHFRQCTIGSVSIVGAEDTSGPLVTINGIEGFENGTDVMGAVITIKKVSTDSWDLFGLLAASTA